MPPIQPASVALNPHSAAIGGRVAANVISGTRFATSPKDRTAIARIEEIGASKQANGTVVGEASLARESVHSRGTMDQLSHADRCDVCGSGLVIGHSVQVITAVSHTASPEDGRSPVD